MSNRNLRPRWIAAVFVALGLLALVAWWRWPQLVRISFSAPAATVASSGPEERVSAHARTSPTRARAHAEPSEDDPELQACDRDFKSELREYRAQLGPARTADEALDQLLLDSLAANPDDWMTGVVWRKYEAARKQWPNDVELAWLGFDRCGTTCDREAALQHLLAVDPDNMAAWMVASTPAGSTWSWRAP